jgi:hypothetical protein
MNCGWCAVWIGRLPVGALKNQQREIKDAQSRLEKTMIKQLRFVSARTPRPEFTVKGRRGDL